MRGLVAGPARGIERYREQGRERFLTRDELAKLGDALREAETDGLPWEVDETKPGAKHLPRESNRRRILDPFAVAAIRLLILTGARLREILDAQWSQVDLERGVIFLADSKTGKKSIYLSAAAQAVLAGVPRIERNPHIIASLGLPIIGKLLGHSQAATTHRYAHLDADPLRRAVDTIGATIAAAMEGNTGADLVRLGKARGAK